MLMFEVVVWVVALWLWAMVSGVAALSRSGLPEGGWWVMVAVCQVVMWMWVL